MKQFSELLEWNNWMPISAWCWNIAWKIALDAM
jgi:hypothetical protein